MFCTKVNVLSCGAMFLKSIRNILAEGHFHLAAGLCQMLVSAARNKDEDAFEKPEATITASASPQIYAHSTFCKYDFIVRLYIVVLTETDFRSEIRSVLSRLFRCEIHEVRGLGFLVGSRTSCSKCH